MANAVTAMLYIGGIFFLLLVCAACNLCRRDGVTEMKELKVSSLEELKLQKTQRDSKRLSRVVQRLRKALNSKEKELEDVAQRETLLTSRLDTARNQVVQDNVDAFDERGRAMYGEAWDDGLENGLPLREVFLMSEEEAKELRAMAAAQVADARSPRAPPPQRGAGVGVGAGAMRGGGGSSSRGGAAPVVPKLNLAALGIGAGPGPKSSRLGESDAKAAGRHSGRRKGKGRKGSARRKSRRKYVEPTPLPPPPGDGGDSRRSSARGYSISVDMPEVGSSRRGSIAAAVPAAGADGYSIDIGMTAPNGGPLPVPGSGRGPHRPSAAPPRGQRRVRFNDLDDLDDAPKRGGYAHGGGSAGARAGSGAGAAAPPSEYRIDGLDRPAFGARHGARRPKGGLARRGTSSHQGASASSSLGPPLDVSVGATRPKPSKPGRKKKDSIYFFQG